LLLTTKVENVKAQLKYVYLMTWDLVIIVLMMDKITTLPQPQSTYEGHGSNKVHKRNINF
jgi:hypothetical protein